MEERHGICYGPTNQTYPTYYLIDTMTICQYLLGLSGLKWLSGLVKPKKFLLNVYVVVQFRETYHTSPPRFEMLSRYALRY